MLLVASLLQASSSLSAKPRWTELFRSPDYRVSLDSNAIRHRPDGSFGVRYETWHLHTATDAGLTFNREEIDSVLRCKPLTFKTERVALYLNGGPSLRSTRDFGADPKAAWRTPRPQSVDEQVMQAACKLLSRGQIGR